MGLLVRFICDRTTRHGTCAALSLPGRTEAEARQQAVASGWYLSHSGAVLCPGHAGTTR